MMNIYAKMATVKQLLNKANLKKSGHNKFAGYDYYELRDFIPFIVDSCTANGILTQVSFTNELALLKVVNIENPEEQIEYTTPFIVPEVKGANACQNAGAAQTYSRRYLYLTAFDIVECDAFDATLGYDAEAEVKARQQRAIEERKAAESKVVVQHGGANRESYYGLLETWKSAGRKEDKLDKWIQDEAKNKGITKVDSLFLNELNQRIISYMVKEEQR